MISTGAIGKAIVKIGASGGSLLAAAHAPVFAAFVVGMALLLITALALIAALSTKKERRDAAYKVLKLILDTLRRPQSSSG